jgi:hypothetical protein
LRAAVMEIIFLPRPPSRRSPCVSTLPHRRNRGRKPLVSPMCAQLFREEAGIYTASREDQRRRGNHPLPSVSFSFNRARPATTCHGLSSLACRPPSARPVRCPQVSRSVHLVPKDPSAEKAAGHRAIRPLLITALGTRQPRSGAKGPPHNRALFVSCPQRSHAPQDGQRCKGSFPVQDCLLLPRHDGNAHPPQCRVQGTLS